MISDIYDPSSIDWENLPTVQSGRGMIGYRGSTRYQRGAGIGTVIRSLFNAVKPFGKKALRSAAKEGLDTVSLIGSDMLEGENLRTSIKNRGRQGARKLVRKAVKAHRNNLNPKMKGYTKLENQTGSGRIGYKKARKKKKKPTKKRRQVGYGKKNNKRGKKQCKRKININDFFGK